MKEPLFPSVWKNSVTWLEMEVETFRVMAARSGNQIQDSKYQMIAIQDLEEAQEEALQRTLDVQAKRKNDFDAKLPKNHEIQTRGMVLLYDNCCEEFLGKLYTRWMGPYRVTYIFPNGSLQLEDL